MSMIRVTGMLVWFLACALGLKLTLATASMIIIVL